MEVRKIVVVVEEVEAAKTALKWALCNLFRYGDLITLLHVFAPTKSRNKKQKRRLKGYQLALSFKEICNSNFFDTNVEIIVTEGDEEGEKLATLVREMSASVLVIGLHDQSFLYKLAMIHNNIETKFNCRVVAVKHPSLPASKTRTINARTRPETDSSINMEFSQIELGRLQYPKVETPKIAYRICPDPYAVLWRRRRKSKRKCSS